MLYFPKPVRMSRSDDDRYSCTPHSVELGFDKNGQPLIADENEPDLTDLALENLEWDEDVEVQEFRALWGDNAPWVDVDELSPEDVLDGIYALRHEKDGYPHEEDGEEEILDALAKCIAGEASTWLGAYRVRDEARDAIRRHALVKEFGFTAASLTGPDGQPFGVETLAVLTAGARAARELGRATACRIMGIKDEGQTVVGKAGVKPIFRSAAALQAEVARREAAKPKPIRLGVSLQVPTAPAAPQRPAQPRLSLNVRMVAPPGGIRRHGKTEHDHEKHRS